MQELITLCPTLSQTCPTLSQTCLNTNQKKNNDVTAIQVVPMETSGLLALERLQPEDE